MSSKILNKIRGNRIGYNIGRKILSTPLIVNSGIYNLIYDDRIKKSIEKLNKKYPWGVDIGVTNLCNAECIMCPHSKLKKMGTMDMKLYKKIIDNCHKLNIKIITLSFFGEPFLDKGLIEKIKYAKEKKMKKTNPSINLVLVELEENKREIKQFYSEWKNKVDSINIINMGNWANEIEKEGTKESFHFNRNIKRKPCFLIWKKMVVDWNGDVVLCCDDWNHSTILGNLKRQTIEEIWKGEKLKKIKEAHIKGEFYKVSLCSGCNKKSIWWMVD
ncbi:MAG: SPASM domain-containing protein [Candidatus Pacearchaeota archaeon]|nr:SPASM domain-containing protein [Candidatus Pacearchaeota archaeon]